MRLALQSRMTLAEIRVIVSWPHTLVTTTRVLAGDAMQIPDAFYDYCTWLHQDSEFDCGLATEDIIAGALKRIRPEQHQLLRAFIEELLTGPIPSRIS